MKIKKVFIGHVYDNKYTEVGFFRKSALERGNWFGGKTAISDASMNRIARLIDDEKLTISNVYPLSKQLWVVYKPNLDLYIPECTSCDNTGYMLGTKIICPDCNGKPREAI